MKILKTSSVVLAESDLRLDASYHLSEGPMAFKKLSKSPYPISSLKEECSRIFSGNIFKRTYVTSSEFGYPYLTGSDMIKSNIDGGKFLSKKYTGQVDNLMIRKDWILISCSGTLGNTVFTNDDFEGRIGTHDLIRAIPNENNTKKGYLYAYLASKIGYALLTQSSYGGVVKHIEPHHIKHLPIPILPEAKQQEIHNLIVEAADLRVEANELLRGAINYFEERIGESTTHKGYQYGSISSNSINKFHKRFDAQFQLLWKELKKECRSNIEYDKIINFAESIFVGGRGKRNYVGNGISFLSSSDMMLYNPKRDCKKVSRNTWGLSSMMVSEKDILISRSGTVGNVVLVGEDLSNSAISEHALRLVIDSKKISPNYVFCYLKTKHGLKSMEASSFGSVIITLNEGLIGNIDLPILAKNEQVVINEKVESYLIKMDLSTKKENQAIDLIEHEIDSWQKS